MPIMNTDKMLRPLGIPLFFLAALTAVVFFQTVRFDFLSFDDNFFISENPHVSQGLSGSGLRWAWTADLLQADPYVDYWQPLTAMSRMLDVSLFGMHAGRQHLAAVALHLLNVWLLFFLFLILSESESAAFWSAAFFAVHPVQVETVAWLSARKDLLAACFSLLSLIVYVRGCQRLSRAALWFAWILFVFALLSKPAYVFVPLLMVLIDRFYVSGMKEMPWMTFLRVQLWGKAHFWLTAAVFFLIARRFVPLGVSLDHAGVVTTNSASAFVLQFAKIFWPFGLGLHDSASARRIFDPGIFFAGLLFTGLITFLLARWSGRRPYLLFGWLWFAAGLFLTTLLRFPADRFLYLPSAGIFFALSQAAYSAEARKQTLKAVLCVLLLACGCLSIRQAGFWKNDYYFFNRSLHRYPDNFVALGSLGTFYYRQGQVIQAVDYYRRAVEASPRDALGHLLLANALKSAGDEAGARAAYARAVEINPAYASSGARLGRLLEAAEPASPLLDKI